MTTLSATNRLARFDLVSRTAICQEREKSEDGAGREVGGARACTEILHLEPLAHVKGSARLGTGGLLWLIHD